MAEDTHPASSPIVSAWRRISPRLVPILAVITAFIIGIPFMVFTRARGNVVDGLHVDSERPL